MKYLEKKMWEQTSAFWKNIEYCMNENLRYWTNRAIQRFIYDSYKERWECLTLTELKRIVKENRGILSHEELEAL